MDVNLARLRVFLAVADTLHFGRAARRLRIAQPSVSQQIARLERQTGCLLFVRDSRGVRLTAAGEDLVRRVGPAVRQLDAAVEDFARSHMSGAVLRVGLLSSLASYVVPVAAASSRVRALGVETTLRESSLGVLVQGLLAGDLDVGFCYGTAETGALDGLRATVLDRRPVTVALPRRLAPDEESPWRWSALDDLAWIMPSASRQYREDMAARFERRGVRVHVVAEATTLSGQLALVTAGVGGTFTSPWVPVPPGVCAGTMEDGEQLELLAVHRGEVPRADAAALVSAVREVVDRGRGGPVGLR